MKFFRVFLIFLFVCFSITALVFYLNFRGFGKSSPKERLVIKLNTSEEQIITDLHEKGFLKSKFVFSLILDLKKWHNKIQPGAYMISKGMNAYELAGTLVYGPFQKWVVIPPGKRKEQVGLILQKSLDWPDSMVLSFITIAKEGYLWPDTYLFNTDSDPKQITDRLEKEFSVRLDDIYNDLVKANIKTDTAVKFASLIERESGSLEDKPIISAIILNRLEEKMRLEIDATVQYAIGTEEFAKYIVNGKIDHPSDFSFWASLGGGVVRAVNSPYNTYKTYGLPLGAICTPSLESLQAVLNPVETEDLYYIHSPDKKIRTAETYKEHQENIKKYLQ